MRLPGRVCHWSQELNLAALRGEYSVISLEHLIHPPPHSHLCIIKSPICFFRLFSIRFKRCAETDHVRTSARQEVSTSARQEASTAAFNSGTLDELRDSDLCDRVLVVNAVPFRMEHGLPRKLGSLLFDKTVDACLLAGDTAYPSPNRSKKEGSFETTLGSGQERDDFRLRIRARKASVSRTKKGQQLRKKKTPGSRPWI